MEPNMIPIFAPSDIPPLSAPPLLEADDDVGGEGREGGGINVGNGDAEIVTGVNEDVVVVDLADVVVGKDEKVVVDVGNGSEAELVV